MKIKIIRGIITTISLTIFTFGLLNLCMAVNGVKPISTRLVSKQDTQTQKFLEAEKKYNCYTIQYFFKDDTEYKGIVRISEVRDFLDKKTDAMNFINPSTGKIEKVTVNGKELVKPLEREDVDRIIITSDGRRKYVIRIIVGKTKKEV